MAKVVTAYGNFSRARLDHDMMGRFDLPVYTTGADVFKNFISNLKGNAIFSAGFMSEMAYQNCVFVEFKFGNTQNYLLCFSPNKIRFAAFDTNGNFGWVTNAGSPLEVATPYTMADCQALQYTQNKDAMIFTRIGLEPRKLVRTASNAFTFNTYARNQDPFPTAWAATKSVTAITQATNAQVTVAGHGLSVGDRVLFASASGMTAINGYTAAVVSVVDSNNFTIDINTTANGFSAYTSGGTIAKVTAGDYPACCLFYKGRLYYAATPLFITKVWFSTAGTYFDHTVPAGTPPVYTDISAFNFVIADISQQILWLFPGDNSLIAGSADGIVAINGGAVNTAITASTVQANITSAEPTNGAYPIKKDGKIFYISRNNRNMYYFSYDILSESFLAKDANISSYDITKGGLSKIRYKKDKNDLIISLRGDGAFCSMNYSGESDQNIIGWHERTSNGPIVDIGVIGDNNGNPQLFILALRNGTYYIEQQQPYVEFAKRSDFKTPAVDDFVSSAYAVQATDKEAYYRYVSEQLRNCVYTDNSLTYSDYRTTQISYDPSTNVITASGASFQSGDVGKHISYKTATGYESGRFEITQYINTTQVLVNVLQNPKINDSTPLYVWSSWYLSFKQITGLNQYNGTTVSLIADGGYVGDFLITGGMLNIPEGQQVCSIVVGYSYIGTIKTFCLGFAFQGLNTQVTMKNIVRASVRTLSSAGGKIGSSPYFLQPVQDLGPYELNYLPPLPIDGTKDVDYTDDAEEDKFLYIVQDQPLPFQITNLFLSANYSP